MPYLSCPKWLKTSSTSAADTLPWWTKSRKCLTASSELSATCCLLSVVDFAYAEFTRIACLITLVDQIS
ncbi:hypothetical protein [Melissococcus plutonius]|uniref:hypothetical protein n=1 Tax=Melissococcus plutonius TaxID=33970 RepID=UPI003F5CDD0F